MVEVTFGLVFGFTVFLFAVAAFIVGLIIYLIILKCRKKDKDTSHQDILGEDIEHVKTEPDGASWESPMAEFDEAISYAENSLPRDHEHKQEAEGAKIEKLHVSPISEEEDEVIIQQDTGVINKGFERTISEQSDGPVYAKVHDHVKDPVEEDKPAPDLDLLDGPVYAKVQDHVPDSTEEKPKVGKLFHRVSFYESASQSSSLIRPSKKKELEGINSKVVSGLVTDFEASDNVLLGRQMSKDPSYILKKSNFNASENGHLDADTGEPLYSVPDLAKKSSRRSNGPKVVVDDHAKEPDGESDIASPGVPPKVLGL